MEARKGLLNSLSKKGAKPVPYMATEKSVAHKTRRNRRIESSPGRMGVPAVCQFTPEARIEVAAAVELRRGAQSAAAREVCSQAFANGGNVTLYRQG
jgi:hypothetical protein